MSILTTNLSPAKNSLDVPVNSNIEITIEDDTYELDVYSVKLYINGVEVQASSYYGSTKNILNIKFFSKKRIKYSSKRYGQEDARYGQVDNIASNFRYGMKYVGKIQVTNSNGDLYEDSFSFIIEEGIFYNLNPNKFFYSQQTQALANYTPEWARSRYDKYSVFQQLINPAGIFLEELEHIIYKQLSSYYLQTSNFNELNTLYEVKLNGDFNFKEIPLDDGSSLQVPPLVEAIKEITIYDIQAEYNNDLDSFYYNKLPTRISAVKTIIEEIDFLSGEIVNNEIKVDKKLEKTGKFFIKVSNKNTFARIKNNYLEFLYCRVYGLNEEGKEQEEEIAIISEDAYASYKRWSKINAIKFVNIFDGGDFKFTYASSNNDFRADFYRHIGTDDSDKSIFWTLREEDNYSVLQKSIYRDIYFYDIVSSAGAREVVEEYALYDVDEVTPIKIDHIEVDPFNQFMYCLNDQFLFIYDKRQDYPQIIKDMKNIGSAFVLDIEADELCLEDGEKTITIQATQKEAGKAISQYRMKITKPDKSFEYLLGDGSVSGNISEATIVVTSRDLNYKSNLINYTLDQVGDYLFEIYAINTDGTLEKDSKIVRVPKKSALVKYKLERILDQNTIQRTVFDGEQRLKIYDSSNQLHTLYFNRDNMLIDYDNNTLYFNEDYDEVIVENED